MKTVTLGGKKAAGRVARIDDEKLEPVSQHHWWTIEGKSGVTYAVTQVRRDGRKVTIYMHGLITGWKGVDHADGDGLNNQQYNLREADQSLNNANQRARGGAGKTSRFKGVCWAKDKGKWQASITINRRLIQLGRYADEAHAARAYDAAALAAWGEFARLNFPEG